MMMIAVLLSFGRPSTSKGAIAFFFLYMLVFGGTLNVVPWVYVRVPLPRVVIKVMTRSERTDSPDLKGPEILPLEARSRGTAISVSSHWTWNFFVVMITPVLINRLEWKTYLIFMCLLVSLSSWVGSRFSLVLFSHCHLSNTTQYNTTQPLSSSYGAGYLSANRVHPSPVFFSFLGRLLTVLPLVGGSGSIVLLRTGRLVFLSRDVQHLTRRH